MSSGARMVATLPVRPKRILGRAAVDDVIIGSAFVRNFAFLHHESQKPRTLRVAAISKAVFQQLRLLCVSGLRQTLLRLRASSNPECSGMCSICFKDVLSQQAPPVKEAEVVKPVTLDSPVTPPALAVTHAEGKQS